MNTPASAASFHLTFLGTCANDFSPRLKTDCRDCFDRDARRSSALLIDGHILIDCGFHTLESLNILHIPYQHITDIFLTHLHSDHFQPENIRAIALAKESPLRVWVRADTDCDFSVIPNVEIGRMNFFEDCLCNTFSTQPSATSGLQVIALPANHAPKSFPQHLLFRKGDKKFFYGCDGAWFMYDTFKFLKDSALDLMVLDCTTGDYTGDFRLAEHNSIPMIRLMLPSLKTIGAVTEKTAVYLSHLAPSLHRSHAETAIIAKEFGAAVAYDGLSILI